LRFLELSGVGRVVEDGTNEEKTWAGRLDRWIVWEGEEKVAQGTHIDHLSPFRLNPLRGTHTPSFAHSALMRAMGFLCSTMESMEGATAGILC